MFVLIFEGSGSPLGEGKYFVSVCGAVCVCCVGCVSMTCFCAVSLSGQLRSAMLVLLEKPAFDGNACLL